MKKILLIEIISFLYILLFMYAAVSKLLDVEKFRVTIGQSPLLTDHAAMVAWAIPIAEVLIAILLVFPRFRMMGLLAAFTLMVMFTGYIIAITQFSEHIPCSCGGVLQKMGWTEHLIFNIGFVLLGLIGILLQSKLKKVSDSKITKDGSVVIT